MTLFGGFAMVCTVPLFSALAQVSSAYMALALVLRALVIASCYTAAVVRPACGQRSRSSSEHRRPRGGRMAFSGSFPQRIIARPRRHAARWRAPG